MFYSRKTSSSQFTLQQTKRIAILNTLIFLITQLPIDFYLPSMPAMKYYFHTSEAMIQATLTSFLLGFATTPLIFGILCDYWGRRPIRLMSLTLALFAALGCMQTQNIHWLLLFRFLQGVSMAGVMVVCRSVWRDLFGGQRLAKVIAYAGVAWCLVPLLAPVMGGYIQEHFGWRTNFEVIFLLTGLGLLFSWKLFPETRSQTPNVSLGIKSIIATYLSIVKHRQFLIFASCMGLAYIIPSAYSTISPFLLQNTLQLDASAYGWSMMFVSTGLLLGQLFSSLLISRISKQKLLRISQISALFSSIVFIVIAIFFKMTLWGIILPTFCLVLSITLAFPLYSAGAMMPFKQVIASAGVMLSTFQIAGWVIGSTLTTIFHNASIIPLAIIFLSVTLCLTLVLMLLPWEDE